MFVKTSYPLSLECTGLSLKEPITNELAIGYYRVAIGYCRVAIGYFIHLK